MAILNIVDMLEEGQTLETNIIPGFSYAGYQGGGVAIPNVTFEKHYHLSLEIILRRFRPQLIGSVSLLPILTVSWGSPTY